MRAVIVSSNPPLKLVNKDNYIIGVDHWCMDLMQNNIKIDLAIGDFDELTIHEKEKIMSYAEQYIELSPEKDNTDTNEALKKALEISPDVLIIGGIQGKRIEHFIANLMLVDRYNIKMVDDNSLIFKLSTGSHTFYKDEYKYVSFFTYSQCELTLKGFKYPLDKYKLSPNDPLCISNEVSGRAKAIIKGEVIVIKSKNDSY